MKGFLKFVGLCAFISTPPVSGIDFSTSPDRFVIGDTATLSMRCSLTETDVSTRYNIKIKRETQPGSNTEELLASFVKENGNEVAKLDTGVTNDKDFQVTGSLTDSPYYIQVTMSMQKMTCSDARIYSCEAVYDTQTSEIKTPTKNATIQVFVLPVMTGPLEAKKNGDYVNGGDSSNKAEFNAGDQLELTCRANIGSIKSTRIQWRKSSEIIDNVFNQYNPAADMVTETDALPDNQCGYTRTSTLKYNVTASDATYNLAFECYVEVTQYPSSTVTPGGRYEIKSDRYYLDVDSDEPSTDEVASAGSGNAGAIAGGVVGGLVLIVIVVLLVYFLWYRRRSSGEDYTTKEEYGSENPNMAPPLDTYAAVDKIKKRGHENRGLDEPHESDRSRRHHYDNNRGAKANYGMDRDVDDYDGYDRDGSPTMGHQGINHMGLDPVDGRIGTGV